MAHKFIKKNGKYYRLNSDNTQTEVQLKDGYFHWVQPDKIKVRTKLDSNLTDLDKSESFLSKAGKLFTNATMTAANADAPAVTAAAGWNRNKDGSWDQSKINSKGAKDLRKNLAILSASAYTPIVIAGAPMIAPGTVGGTAIGNAAGSMAIGTALEEGQRAVTGKSTGDIISQKLQEWRVPTLIADMARPEYFVNPTGAVAKTALNASSKAIPKRITSNVGSFGVIKPSEVAKDAFIDNPVALHMSRIENGGWDKLVKMHKDLGYEGKIYYDRANGWSAPYLAKSPNISVYSSEYNYGIPRKKSGQIEYVPNDSPIAFRKLLEQNQGGFAPFSKGYLGVSADLPPRLQQVVISHEMDHALHIPLGKPGVNEGFDFSFLPLRGRAYFEKANGSEIAARGSQIKDWLGFTKAGQKITPQHLKAASKHYVNQTGIDNSMTEFFNSIVDFKKAAKWLSDNATAIGGLGIGTTMYNQTNKDV